MTKAESADLILKLYDLRREKKMREARTWIFGFNPTTVDDYWKTVMDPEVGAYLRMVTTYWEMAATLVVHGAIDAEMFNEAVGEHILVFSKIEPILAELRERFQNPRAFQNLEKVIMALPDGKERVLKNQEFQKMIREQTAAARAGETAS